MKKSIPFVKAMSVAILILFSMSLTPLASWAQSNYDRSSDQHNYTIFMKDGGWCWYQDPRAIIKNNILYLGSVHGNGSGAAWLGIYDLEGKKSLGKVLMKDHFGHDDHNSPVLYARPDGSILAVYARHHKDKFHYYRISNPAKPLKWGKEKRFKHDYPAAGNITYMNLFYLEKENKLYNFFRGINFNPSFITSIDHGKIWGEPTHLIEDEVEGRHRPYARYAGNGQETVHISFTDAHPHLFGNNIYYAAFRDGKFFRANGTFMKDLKKEGPLKTSEAELVFQGSNKTEDRKFLSAPNSAWTSSMSYDKNGHPHIGYTLYKNNNDHRYRIASWDGTKWIDREVAFGGKCLYLNQSSYTGLISLDPRDPAIVVISSDVDPSNGYSQGGKHEIYRAKIGKYDDVSTIKWEAITMDSPVRNLRPVIINNEGFRAITWLRGDYHEYVDYDLDVVGIIEKVK